MVEYSEPEKMIFYHQDPEILMSQVNNSYDLKKCLCSFPECVHPLTTMDSCYTCMVRYSEPEKTDFYHQEAKILMSQVIDTAASQLRP